MTFHHNQPLFYMAHETPALPTFAQMKNLIPTTCEKLIYLFEIDQIGFFMVPTVKAMEEDDNISFKNNQVTDFSFGSMREFRHFKPVWMGFAGVSAGQLYRWYRSNRFCGVCGHPMELHDTERAMHCPVCGYVDYPKICPAIIVGIIDPATDRIMLTKYANRTFTRYALIAGFTEFGETLEDTVHREVMEEVGLKVKNIRYYKNQPWAFSESLLVGFFAELDGDSSITLDTNELAVGEWKKREEIPDDEENSLSLTYTMMKAFKDGEV
ncbi:MAG: NAD(+) diphosphatase [Lachnospira sp.]|nr:NAD(+) diphosphatase [Lachnospira sp.]